MVRKKTILALGGKKTFRFATIKPVKRNLYNLKKSEKRNNAQKFKFVLTNFVWVNFLSFVFVLLNFAFWNSKPVFTFVRGTITLIIIIIIIIIINYFRTFSKNQENVFEITVKGAIYPFFFLPSFIGLKN